MLGLARVQSPMMVQNNGRTAEANATQPREMRQWFCTIGMEKQTGAPRGSRQPQTNSGKQYALSAVMSSGMKVAGQVPGTPHGTASTAPEYGCAGIQNRRRAR